MASPLKQYLERSVGVLKRNTSKVLRMDGTTQPPPLRLLSFTSSSSSDHPITPISDLATGSDIDIGGLSTCHLSAIPLNPSSSAPSSSSSSSAASSSTSTSSPPEPISHLSFHGNLSLAVPPAYAGKIRTGYAAFRNKTRTSLFGEDMWDLSLYSHLKVVLAYRGLDSWRGRWYLNIQTDGPVRSDLYQHHLALPPSSASLSSLPDANITPTTPSLPAPTFITLHLPLSSFTLTNSGQTAASQLPMMRTAVRTVGMSLLGGGRSTEDSPVTPDGAAGTAGAEFAEQEKENEKKRLSAGGWKGASTRPGDRDVEMDVEMEELIRSDRPASAAPGPAARAAPLQGQSGNYHRVGSTSVPLNTEGTGSPAAAASGSGSALQANVSGEQQGYFELCVKSIEAVRWDPESESESEGEGEGGQVRDSLL